MPECVSVSEFVQEVQEDWNSPTTSSFTSKMISCRNTVYLLEEVSTDRGGVAGSGSSLKILTKITFCSNSSFFSICLPRLSYHPYSLQCACRISEGNAEQNHESFV
uniref:Uncharacterized protein n=1 Tax=Haplochromis burtoni TaxID=8153 RepID=A0A3Q2VM09_HAPBU